MHLIDESGMKVFSDCCDAAAQADIFSFSSLSSARERIVDAICDEWNVVPPLIVKELRACLVRTKTGV